MQRKKLPIGIQNFREIREEGYYYVDKTPFALRLIDQGKHYFLSRPRRFGKSLFLDTLKELFEANQTLFTGLYAEHHWDWSIQYSVIRISFGGAVVKTQQELYNLLSQQFDHLEQTTNTKSIYPDMGRRLQHLIQYLHQQSGQRVAVLVDEYDKPILDNLTDPLIAREMRDTLRNLYSVLKDNDADLKFVLITGVSKFSKVSLFSGLNNLNDITVDAEYSAICGYTDQDIDTVFADELEGLERDKIRDWYNGYRWTGQSVYNPFDLLLLFQKRQFKAYWFETATPTFLVDFLAERHFFTPDLSRLAADAELLSSFDIDNIEPEALLWQTGYLSIQSHEEIHDGEWVYVLGYPNREVEASLNISLLPKWGVPRRAGGDVRRQLPNALRRGDMAALRQHFEQLFASIPHDWYRNNPLAQYEGYYASVFYSQLAALGMHVQPEDTTNHGRIDLSLRLGPLVYLFEFKVLDGEADGTALQQLIAKGYADKFREPGTAITLIGIEFSKAERNVVGFDVFELEPVSESE